MIHSHEIQSDNSTTITKHIITSNRNEKNRKQQQHVSIDPTIIEKNFNQNELNQQQQITSPILSPTSSDADIERNIINQTPSPTLNQTHLQSVSEHETLQTKSMSDIFKRHSNDENRPPARLDTRNSSLSNSTE